MNMLNTFVKQAIRDHPEVAAKEIPEIIEHYISDNTRLNRVYQAACKVVIQPDRFTLDNLRRAVAVADAERRLG